MVLEHRIVVEKAIGRILKDYEVVHHIDENKSNNVLYNLFLCENDTQHKKIHNIDKQFLMMFNLARYDYPKEFKNFDILNSRQDQLQEMLSPDVELDFDWLYGCVEKMYQHGLGMFKLGLKTMEQLWLAFVMKEKYNKIWDGKKWKEKP